MDEGNKQESVEVFQELYNEFREYHEESQEREFQRRRENVQVLIALAVIGGYISFEASRKDFFNTGLSEIVLLALVSSSGVFLFIKMTTITVRPDFNHPKIEFFDELVAPMLYLLSVYGLIGVAGITALLNYIDQIPLEVRIIAQGIAMAVAIFGVASYASRARLRRIAKSEKQLRTKLAATLSLLQNKNIIESSKSDELAMRFDRVLSHDREFSLLDGFIAGSSSTGSAFTLRSSDRKRLNNVVERIRIRLGQGTDVKEDVERLEEILTEIEER
ncbi:hypothetical protein [Haloarchaeobius litoreus]|uniref:Uncharacterized protein n=1 Tax=Haloarchaeobius litoreus TaxID=755306 RepID=A0ABD6DE63_9EURY|nr:hypothetical protein [Haloarchaeobius litoreus]